MKWQHPRDFWERNKQATELVVGFVIGVFGVMAFGPRGTYPSSFLEHLSMAMAVASLIGVVIDVSMKRELVKNVFEAAIGHLLPEELRSELRWIYDTQMLCENHVQQVVITSLANTRLVVVKTLAMRTFRNFSEKAYDYPLGIGIDEFYFQERQSRIIRFCYQLEGEDEVSVGPERIKKHWEGWHISPNLRVKVESGKTLVISVEFEEVRRDNDYVFINFAIPTVNPTVVITGPDHLHAHVGFDHREKRKIKQHGNTWQLEGILLPHQNIRVRWHNKADSTKWLAS